MSGFSDIRIAILFGSMAQTSEGPDSDIDLAIQVDTTLQLHQRLHITEAIALAFNRPVDIVDLRTAGQPLLHQILSTGALMIGTRHQWWRSHLSKHYGT